MNVINGDEHNGKHARAADGTRTQQEVVQMNTPEWGIKVIGKVLATEGFYTYSDERLKTNITALLAEESLQTVLKLRPVRNTTHTHAHTCTHTR